MLKGKNILLGVTEGIAVYKAADLVSKLKKQHASIDVIMTEGATKFVTWLKAKYTLKCLDWLPTLMLNIYP